ncbi:MAG: Ig-like domain-containing protein [Clostridiales bacterium]|nr:Ig-like domain-containing protein [Clostridiales bacterium]
MIWTSGNGKYATVNQNGRVTTKKAGKGKTVVITAEAKDGSGKSKRESNCKESWQKQNGYHYCSIYRWNE